MGEELPKSGAQMKLILEGSIQDIMDFIGQTVLKTSDSVIPEGSEPAGYEDRIYQRLEEKLRKKDSVLSETSADPSLGDRIEPDPYLDVHGEVD
jgi:fructose-1-phosphate kinase PfkB-like protein